MSPGFRENTKNRQNHCIFDVAVIGLQIFEQNFLWFTFLGSQQQKISFYSSKPSNYKLFWSGVNN